VATVEEAGEEEAMTIQLSDVGQDLFDQLASRTFYVVDTEFCTHDGEHHLISIAIVPVIGGHRAKASEEAHFVMNPGVPIDKATSKIHGFTDADVARKRPFNHYARVILARLREPDAVFVCHNTIDAHVLRRELERLDQRAADGESGITAGLADLPVMPVLDTQRLAHASGFPGVGKSTRVSLDTLCDLAGVPRTSKAHDAREDARATANAFIEVLRHCANMSLYWTYDALQEDGDGGTTESPRGPAHIKPRDKQRTDLPQEHIARHIYPLSDPVSAGSDEAEEWLQMAYECAQLRCPHLRDESTVAAPANGGVLLRDLMDDLPHLTEPGQAGTLLGAASELITHGEPPRSTLSLTSALRWWATTRPIVTASPPCDRSDPDTCCPSCREGGPCPRHTFYLALAELVTVGEANDLTRGRVKKLLHPGNKGPVKAWRRHHVDVLAYALWRASSLLLSEGEDERAHDALMQAMGLNLHTIEPRLTIMACQQLVDDGDTAKAFTVADAVLAQRTTDTAYDELADWVPFTRNALYEQQPRPRKPITYRRLARPQTVHSNPRLYS
jgi:DNA polymerase III epsilon subunit-like protein